MMEPLASPEQPVVKLLITICLHTIAFIVTGGTRIEVPSLRQLRPQPGFVLVPCIELAVQSLLEGPELHFLSRFSVDVHRKFLLKRSSPIPVCLCADVKSSLLELHFMPCLHLCNKLLDLFSQLFLLCLAVDRFL